MTQYFLLSLWSFGNISYTVVITRPQVAGSSKTFTVLFAFVDTNNRVLLNALAGNKEYV